MFSFVMSQISTIRSLRRSLRRTTKDCNEWMEAAINAEAGRLRSRHGDVEADQFHKRVRYIPEESMKAICGRRERLRREEERSRMEIS